MDGRGRLDYGKVDKNTLGQEEAQLAGNIVAICSSGLICTICSLVSPQNFDWKGFEVIKLIEEVKTDIPEWESSDEFLLKARAWIIKYGWGYTVLLIFAWPMACLPFGVLPKAVYNLWCSVALMWGWVAAMVIIGLPIWENMTTVGAVLTCSPKVKEDKPVKETEVTSSTQA